MPCVSECNASMSATIQLVNTLQRLIHQLDHPLQCGPPYMSRADPRTNPRQSIWVHSAVKTHPRNIQHRTSFSWMTCNVSWGGWAVPKWQRKARQGIRSLFPNLMQWSHYKHDRFCLLHATFFFLNPKEHPFSFTIWWRQLYFGRRRLSLKHFKCERHICLMYILAFQGRHVHGLEGSVSAVWCRSLIHSYI